MSEMKKLREEYRQKISELQSNCPHTQISDWVDYYWAIGHSSGTVRYCLNCEKIIDRLGVVLK